MERAARPTASRQTNFYNTNPTHGSRIYDKSLEYDRNKIPLQVLTNKNTCVEVMRAEVKLRGNEEEVRRDGHTYLVPEDGVAFIAAHRERVTLEAQVH